MMLADFQICISVPLNIFTKIFFVTVTNSTKNSITDAWEDPKYYFIKAVRIRSFSGPYVPAFGQNMKIYFTNLRILSKCGKIQNRKTPIQTLLMLSTPLECYPASEH